MKFRIELWLEHRKRKDLSLEVLRRQTQVQKNEILLFHKRKNTTIFLKQGHIVEVS